MKKLFYILGIGVSCLYSSSSYSSSNSLEEEKSSGQTSSLSQSVSQKNPRTFQAQEYECFFDKETLRPDFDDPYIERPTILSSNFIQWQTSQNQPPYTYGTNLITLGDYTIDQNTELGSGVDGTIYLGKHNPTGIFVSAKHRNMAYKKEEYHQEYRNLKALGRLYSAWRKVDDSIGHNAYLFIPFVDGVTMSSAFKDFPQANLVGNHLTFQNPSLSYKLTDLLINELAYVAKRGVTHPEPSSVNMMVTHNFNQLTLIDFGYSEDYNLASPSLARSIKPSDFKVTYYTHYFHYFFGTLEYVDDIHREDLSPYELVGFFRQLGFKGHSRWDPRSLEDLMGFYEDLRRPFIIPTLKSSIGPNNVRIVLDYL